MATADELLARGEQMLDQTQAEGGAQFAGSAYDTPVDPGDISLTGGELSAPPEQVDLTDTYKDTPDTSGYKGLIKNVAEDTQNTLTSLEEKRAAEDEAQATYNAAGLTDFAKSRRDFYGDYGVDLDKDIPELKDILLQLNDMETDSDLTQARISGAAGQTVGQARRELTQEDKEFAVRSAGLAARASILQGNIETARTLVNDAMDDLYAQEEIKLTKAKDQLDRAREVADTEEQNLLDAKEKEYDLRLTQIQDTKKWIEQAILSGATQAEIAQLSDPNLSEEAKLKLAQSVVAREAGIDASLARENLRSQIRERTGEDLSDDMEQSLRDDVAGLLAEQAYSDEEVVRIIRAQYDPDDFGFDENLSDEEKQAKLDEIINMVVQSVRAEGDTADDAVGFIYEPGFFNNTVDWFTETFLGESPSETTIENRKISQIEDEIADIDKKEARGLELTPAEIEQRELLREERRAILFGLPGEV